MIEIFPAIDLQNGLCVRLKQGAFDKATTYSDDPLAVAAQFAQDGAHWVHLVDLDGARDGTTRQTTLIERIARQTPLSVQAGGGVRTADDIERLLDAGVRRIVVGSIGVTNPALVRAWLARFGADRIVLAFDVRIDKTGTPEVLTNGWQQTSRQSLWEALTFYEACGLRTVLCTDVARDGMLTGPNLDLYRACLTRFPTLDLLASGGVASLSDLQALSAAHLTGVITGKALYENRFTLPQALRAVQGGCHVG